MTGATFDTVNATSYGGTAGQVTVPDGAQSVECMCALAIPAVVHIYTPLVMIKHCTGRAWSWAWSPTTTQRASVCSGDKERMNL